jgi:hypothetical protein
MEVASAKGVLKSVLWCFFEKVPSLRNAKKRNNRNMPQKKGGGVGERYLWTTYLI